MIRRGIFGVLAGACTAGPAAAKAALEGMAPALLSPRPLMPTDYSGACPQPCSSDSSWRIPDGPLRELLSAAHRRREQENQIESEIRYRVQMGLDPDIASNSSWSPAYKRHVQADRVRHEREIDLAITERLWGH